ncbi:MAG: DNA translocase FtsK 4TM domain-containing protein, partial [Planctomycetaceae bacterium]
MAIVDAPPSLPFPARAAGRPAPPAAPRATAPRDRVRDFGALLLLAACVFLGAALVTFDPADPPRPSAFPANARAANACGTVGSILAGAGYRTFGLGAWAALGFLAALDVALLRRRVPADLPLRTAGAVAAVAGTCTLLAMFLPAGVPRPLWGPGGDLGAAGRLVAEGLLARTGAAIVTVAVTLTGLSLACDALVARVAASLVALGGAVIGLVGGLGRALPRRGATPAVTPAEAAAPTVAGAAEPWWQRRRRTGAVTADGEGDAGAVTADAVGADDDGEDEGSQGPTIRVRRRPAPAAAEVAFDAGDDDADDSSAVSEAEEEDESEAPSADQPAPSRVPIRTPASRRAPVQVTMDEAGPGGAEYVLPPLDLLLPTEHHALDEQESEVRERARMLEKTFAEFGFKVRVVEVETGPVISQYEIELEAGLRLAKIVNLADDLAIALRVPSVRIVAPIPGKNSVGIEVPNTTRQMVRLREVMEETQAKAKSLKIPLFLGKDVAGNPMVVDMASMPHLLIAGRTGTGKSV